MPIPQLTWRLEEATLDDVRKCAWQVAVLPMGATEPHNLHLPYSTDSIEATQLADASCRRAAELGASVVQLPTLPFGTESNLNRFPLALNLQPSTVFQVLRDLVNSVEVSGIRKLVILNSHGGNDLKPFLREIYGQTQVHVFLCNWFQMIKDVIGQICQYPDDHAGEMETSLILYFRPDLVRHQKDGTLAADDGAVRPFRLEALQQGWVSVTRPWHLLTTNSGSGFPHAATIDKGRQITEQVTQRLGRFLADLSKAEIDETFPFA